MQGKGANWKNTILRGHSIQEVTMFPANGISGLVRKEDGVSMGTAVIIVAILAIASILFLDGTSVYQAYQSAGEVSLEAAREASLEYKTYRSDIRAENAAAAYCEDNDMDFLEFEVLYRDMWHPYRVACGRSANTIVFKYLPFLKDLTYQKQSARSDNA